MWLWGEGVKANLENFRDKYGLKASMISAVDLLKGIGKFSGMNVVNVKGATGYIDTNFQERLKRQLMNLKAVRILYIYMLKLRTNVVTGMK